MRRANSLIVFLIGCVSVMPVTNAWDREQAQRVAEDYAQELEREQEPSRPPSQPAPPTASEPSRDASPALWHMTAETRMAAATYKETFSNVKSDYVTAYPEAAVEIRREDRERAMELAIVFAMGQSFEAQESWDVDKALFQTNDLDFLHLDSAVRLGKIWRDPNEQVRIVPFLGYGFRHIRFERSNFNILDLIRIRETVTETFQLHHLDAGINLEYIPSPRWGLDLGAWVGWPFFNQANNSRLGKVRGGGGSILRGSLGFHYALGQTWTVGVGGFVDLQNLHGGERDNIIWPDNDLNIYGGQLLVSRVF